jgi:hypothetical protein
MVFTIPKMLRGIFRKRRQLLSLLFQSAIDTLPKTQDARRKTQDKNSTAPRSGCSGVSMRCEVNDPREALFIFLLCLASHRLVSSLPPNAI